MSQQKLHVYLVLEFKEDETRVLKVCISREIAEGVIDKRLKKSFCLLRDNFTVLKISVQGTVLRACYDSLGAGTKTRIIACYGE